MSDIIKEAFGKELTRIRHEKDMTQEGTSLGCDMSLRYFQYLEKGDNNPTIITLFRLAETLDCEPSDLLRDAWKTWKKESKKNR